jgi:hypothetical protein
MRGIIRRRLHLAFLPDLAQRVRYIFDIEAGNVFDIDS